MMKTAGMLCSAVLLAAALLGCGLGTPQGGPPRDPVAAIPPEVLEKMSPADRAAVERGKQIGEQMRQQNEAFFRQKAEQGQGN